MRRTASLRLRVAAWYGGLTGVVAMLISLYGYALHSRTHYDALDDMLERDAVHIATEWAEAGSSDARTQTLAAAALLGARARIHDAAGVVVRATPEPPTDEPTFNPRTRLGVVSETPYPALAALLPSSRERRLDDGTLAIARSRSGARWRTYTIHLADHSGYLTAMLPLKMLDASVAEFGRRMLASALVATLLTFFAGWVVARRVLRPVAVLSASALARSRTQSRPEGDGRSRDELVVLEAAFHDVLAGQEELVEAQQRFIAAASHELRAPLTVVLANLDLLERMLPRMSEEDRVQALSEAHSEAARMARLVADLLLLARADARVPLRREHVELDRVVIDVLGELRHQVHGQRLAIAGFEPSTVLGDPDRLKQLVLILVDNAIKYTPADGRVDVSVRTKGRMVCIEVIDTGIGLAAGDLDRAFERFYRADIARSRNQGGSGLGLSIARWIAEEHGGTVRLMSKVGKGTTATVRLPLA